MKEKISKKAEEIKGFLTEFRRDLHQHPELSFKEFRTSEKIAQALKQIGLEVQTGVGKTGVVGLLRGKTGNKVIGLRGDMDALPVEELNQTSYVSENRGVMHACGHDGHSTIILGAARVLHSLRDELPGTIKFIFQPAEEAGGKGAAGMIRDGVLKSPDLSAILGVHMWPAPIGLGQIGLNYGPSMAASDSFHLRIIGKGGHAALPHMTIDPVVIAAQVINMVQLIASRMIDPLDPVVVSIGLVKGGTRHNIIANEVELRGTVRTLRPEMRTKIREKLERIAKGVTDALDATYEFNYTLGVAPTINEANLTRLVEESAREILGEHNVLRLEHPHMTGEDFGALCEAIPGTFIKVGVHNPEKGYVHVLHSPHFDFDEDALVTGVKTVAYAAMKYLSQNQF
jgi:amidohydrolase